MNCRIENCKSKALYISAGILCKPHYDKIKREVNLEAFRKKGREYYYAHKDKRIAESKRWQKANLNLVILNNRKFTLKKYGLTLVDYNELKTKQQNVCEICKKSAQLHVDHNHETGKVRGLLCNNCNNGLGRFKDSIEFLLEASAYLKRNKCE